MADHTPEHRLATIEQVLRDMRGDIDDLRKEHREDHHRLRNVNAVTDMLARAHEDEKREREAQLRQVGIKIQWLSLAVAFGGLVMGLGLGILAALR